MANQIDFYEVVREMDLRFGPGRTQDRHGQLILYKYIFYNTDKPYDGRNQILITLNLYADRSYDLKYYTHEKMLCSLAEALPYLSKNDQEFFLFRIDMFNITAKNV